MFSAQCVLAHYHLEFAKLFSGDLHENILQTFSGLHIVKILCTHIFVIILGINFAYRESIW